MHFLLRHITKLRFLRSGLRRRILKATYPLSGALTGSFSANLRGQTLTGRLENAQDYSIYFYGAYEPFELDLIELLTERIANSVCFDVGCNMGQHTLVMAKRASKVFAFDPLDAVRVIAERRIAENSLSNTTFFAFGLGNEDRSREFYFDSSSVNNATGSFIKGHDPAGKSVGELQIRIGDDVADSLQLDRLDLVKIDVEGFEGSVISGLVRTLERHSPFVMFEVTPSSMPLFRATSALESLQNCGYSLFEIERGRPVLGLFEQTILKLKPVPAVEARRTSYNLIAIPGNRADLLVDIINNR